MTDAELKNYVEQIAHEINYGATYEECPDCGVAFADHECPDCGRDDVMSGSDYIQDALDIEYAVDGTGDYLGARILVAFGGPNIWINTRRRMVEGYWWSEEAYKSFSRDPMGIDDICRELWTCR